MKKQYINPATKVVSIQNPKLLAGSYKTFGDPTPHDDSTIDDEDEII